MIIYEITAVVRSELVEKYEKYMREKHLPDLFETGFFSGIYFTRSAENCFRVRCEAVDRAALDRYLDTLAEGLRADFCSHFPEGVELSREIWEVLKGWRKD